MIFYIMIGIIFIAELIIAVAILSHLNKWGKEFRKIDSKLQEIKPQIQHIAKIYRKISEQLAELAPFLIEDFKNALLKYAISGLKGAFAGVLLFSVKRKWKIKKIKGLGLLKLVRMLS